MNEDPFGAHNPEPHELPVERSREELDLEEFVVKMKTLDNDPKFVKQMDKAARQWIDDFTSRITQESINQQYFALFHANTAWFDRTTNSLSDEFKTLMKKTKRERHHGAIEHSDLVLETAMNAREWEEFKKKGTTVARSRLRAQYAAWFWEQKHCSGTRATSAESGEAYTALNHLAWSDSDDN